MKKVIVRKEVVVPIVTALITAASTIAVAYIAIIPKVHKTQPPPESAELISVSGIAYRDESQSQTLNNVEISLLPVTGNELLTTTDDKGEFSLREVPKRDWYIMIRNLNADDKPSKKLLLKASGDITVHGGYIVYDAK